MKASACGWISVDGAVRERPVERRSQRRGAIAPREASPSHAPRRARYQCRAVEVQQLHRHRVEHLVADDHAAQRSGSASTQRTRSPEGAQSLALALAQRAGEIDDACSAPTRRRAPRAAAPPARPNRRRIPRPRPLPLAVERLRHLARQGAAEQRRQLGRGDEVAARLRHQAELAARRSRSSPRPGRVERERHEAVERQPAARAVDGHADQSRESRRYTAVVQALVHRRIVGIVVAPSAFANAAAVAAELPSGRVAAPRRKLPVEIAKLKKRLHRQVGQAIADFA